MEELFKIKPGQSLEGIPHKAWNAFVDAARYVKGQQASLLRDALRDVPQTGIVRLKNTSGYDRNRFDVLGIRSVFPTPTANLSGFKSGPVLHGVTPVTPTHEGKFAILLEPAPSGSIVSACVAGVCVAKIDVAAEWHEFVEVRNGDAGSLQTCERGSALILWKQSGLSIRWAVIKIGLPCKQGFWARLHYPTPVGPNRWIYSFTEVIHTGTGYGGWVSKPNGRTGYAYNSVEDPNDGAGLEGNGVDVDAPCCPVKCVACCPLACCGQPACKRHLLPAGPGAIVRMRELRHGNGAVPRVEYWFQFENQVICGRPTPSSSSSSSSSSGPPSSSSSNPSSSSSSSPPEPSSSSGPSSSGLEPSSSDPSSSGGS